MFARANQVGLLGSNAEMMARITALARRGVARVECAAFNGGASLFQLLAGVKDRLVDGFEVKLLAWDHRSAALPAGNEISQSLRREIARLDRVLQAQNAYDPAVQAADFTELACEYLLLASDVLAVPGRHTAQIAQIAAAVETNLGGAVAQRNGSAIVRKSPIYMPGRLFLIDAEAFFSLYLHNNQVGTILHTRRGQPLFDRLQQHFEKVWSRSSGPLFALGAASSREAAHWASAAPAPGAAGPRLFLSYRRADAPWAVARLYDRLACVYGREGVFFDQQSIAATSRFPEEIRQTLDAAALVVVAIGPSWLDAADASGRRRLDDPGDWVLAEVAHALAAGKPVLPVLVDGAQAPPAQRLPPSIQGLSERQALPLRFDAFDADARRILEAARRLAPAF